jgi:hypothetical protein
MKGAETMEEKELIDGITALLKDSGFAQVAKRTSSRSVTLSAQKADRNVLVHLAGPEPAAGPRTAANPEMLAADSVRVRAGIPVGTAAVASGSGAHTTPKRKSAS